MKAKQSNLFILYSFSIIFITSVFSASIFFSVNYQENNRIEGQMIQNIQSMAKASDFRIYAKENNIRYIVWSTTVQDDEPIMANTVIQTNRPTSIQHIEKITVQQFDTFANSTRYFTMHSYSDLVEYKGELVVLQILTGVDNTNAMLNTLSKVLIFGGGIVSILGIVLGIVLSYLNMLPVVKSWMQQRAFVADASHELRTPLSIITLKSDRLLTNTTDTIYDHIEDVAVIQNECRRMHKMVNDLLFLAKSDSGVVEVERADFDITNLTTELANLYNEFFELEDKQLIFDLEYTGKVYADYEKIKQVCMIIIDNALRFTVQDDFINIKIEARGNRILVTISNNGEPIDTKEMPKIFDRFYKSDSSRTKNENEGNGLGLSIAQEILNAHQSRIKVSSDHGITSFSFFLQRSKDNK